MLTQTYLRENLHYSIITGQFYWLKSASPRVKFGDIAGSFDKDGYIRFCVGKKKYSAHRLAWFWVTGEFPKNQIDHKNGVKDANYWLNLREATPAQNRHNVGVQSNNTSGYKGVVWHKQYKKWYARIMLNGNRKALGLYETPKLAYEARLKAEKELYGDFAKVSA